MGLALSLLKCKHYNTVKFINSHGREEIKNILNIKRHKSESAKAKLIQSAIFPTSDSVCGESVLADTTSDPDSATVSWASNTASWTASNTVSTSACQAAAPRLHPGCQ